jgi:hypothetical protein
MSIVIPRVWDACGRRCLRIEGLSNSLSPVLEMPILGSDYSGRQNWFTLTELGSRNEVASVDALSVQGSTSARKATEKVWLPHSHPVDSVDLSLKCMSWDEKYGDEVCAVLCEWGSVMDRTSVLDDDVDSVAEYVSGPIVHTLHNATSLHGPEIARQANNTR